MRHKTETAGHEKIKSMVNAYNIDAISIGNGTASRETEFFIKKIAFDRAVQVSFRGGCFGIFCIKNRS
jgi:transcriptional accessory protein Tex/SPT6